jgi:hypothetical protein
MTEIITSAVKNKRTNSPLLIEEHPEDYIGFPFITLIQYKKQPLLTIVDNINDSSVKAYVLDLCRSENINEDLIVTVAANWFYNNSANYPVSIEYSKQNLLETTSKIYKILNIEFITRVIGPTFRFPTNQVSSVRRRRRKGLAEGIEIKDS